MLYCLVYKIRVIYSQMIADEKKQMIADIPVGICEHLASFNLC
jgi:hypothetical protein